MKRRCKSDGPAVSDKGQAAAEARRRRKAALLRENLMKRKAQSRERAPDSASEGSAGPESKE